MLLNILQTKEFVQLMGYNRRNFFLQETYKKDRETSSRPLFCFSGKSK